MPSHRTLLLRKFAVALIEDPTPRPSAGTPFVALVAAWRVRSWLRSEIPGPDGGSTGWPKLWPFEEKRPQAWTE